MFQRRFVEKFKTHNLGSVTFFYMDLWNWTVGLRQQIQYSNQAEIPI